MPDAYVVLGNGVINAAASGHGFRRFVFINSDLLEVGGAAREPDALRFVIAHEVGHIAAGHTSYWRILGTIAAQWIPVVGSTLSRAQEYTADNFGHALVPQGARLAMATLAGGKYLNRSVDVDAMADRAVTEPGFFVWVANASACHPVLVWRCTRCVTGAGPADCCGGRASRGSGAALPARHLLPACARRLQPRGTRDLRARSPGGRRPQGRRPSARAPCRAHIPDDPQRGRAVATGPPTAPAGWERGRGEPTGESEHERGECVRIDIPRRRALGRAVRASSARRGSDAGGLLRPRPGGPGPALERRGEQRHPHAERGEAGPTRLGAP